MFRTFNFQPPDNQTEAEARTRLIFVLVVAVVILFALYLRLQSSADTNERAIRLLVEALGQERFDWDRAASLPDGPRLVTVSPAYNEAENVAAVIKAMPQMVEGYHVVPVVVSRRFRGPDGSRRARGRCVRGRAARSGGAGGSRSGSATRSR